MNSIYNVGRLKEFREFDAMRAMENFGSSQAYFDQLDYFTETRHGYMKHYNPALVINSGDIQEDFSNSLESVKGILTTLEMSSALTEIKSIENALFHNNEKELSDGLVKFYTVLELSAANIASALMPTEGLSKKKVILAADDNPQTLSYIESILESEYRVIAVTSAKMAIKAMDKFTPSLFLLDTEMSGMNGYALAHIIRGRNIYKSTPILFLTSKATWDDVKTALMSGGNEYIIKPINKEVLLSKIQLYLRG